MNKFIHVKAGFVIPIVLALSHFNATAQNIADDYKHFIQEYSFEVQSYPESEDDILGINISNSRTTNVPIYGGIYVTGLDFWYEDPSSGIIAFQQVDQDKFLSLEIDGDQVSLFRIAGPSGGPKEKLTGIEKGIYQFKVYGSGIYIYGFTAQHGVVYRFENNELSSLYKSKRAVKDIAISDETIAVCEGEQITFLDQSGKINSVFQIDLRINGVAFGNDNTLFLATELGVLQYYSFDGGNYDIITRLINGPLDYIDNTLYLLFKPDFKVIKIQLG